MEGALTPALTLFPAGSRFLFIFARFKRAMLKQIPGHLLSIVVPLYNEEENVRELTRQIHAALTGYQYEIIYVDDFSTDRTREVVKSMDDGKVKLVELKKNYGQSMALNAGMDLAGGDFIVTMDGDLQNDPADIPMMLQTAIDGEWDVVTGIRQNRKDSFLKTIPSKIANFIVRRATKLDIKDNGCALKVFRREITDDIILYGEMHRFITLLAYLSGATITQVPVRHHPRMAGKSKYGLERIFKVISDVILILFLRKYLQRPIHLFGNIGMGALLAGLAIFIYLVVLKFMGQDIWGRPIMIAGVVLVLAGAQFFTVGLILEMLTRTYYESQDKKPYKIRRVFVGDAELPQSSFSASKTA
jgi:glycosyltransferase involved in cell wall biosynthesis